jgi:hypothetical protein
MVICARHVVPDARQMKKSFSLMVAVRLPGFWKQARMAANKIKVSARILPMCISKFSQSH